MCVLVKLLIEMMNADLSLCHVVCQVWETTDCCINVCSELDWKRCLAVHLWYMLPPTASVADALARYQAAFQVQIIYDSLDSLDFLKEWT